MPYNEMEVTINKKAHSDLIKLLIYYKMMFYFYSLLIA